MAKREIRVYQDLMGANDKWAQRTRGLLAEKAVLMPNLIGAPGCGKTSLLEAMAQRIGGRFSFAVLEGDCATTHDAERLHRLGLHASQILTSGGCHLQAKSVHLALKDLPLDELDVVIVENVGNLICPAEMDLGEHFKVAALSVAEGEDKPVKYPMLFREVKAVVLTKVDLLPHLPFRLGQCIDYIRQINGTAPIFQVSAMKGDGMDTWMDWLEEQHRDVEKH